MKPLIFMGTSLPKLASEIVKLNSLSFGEQENVRFANSEFKVTIKSDVKDKDCFIIQSTANPTDQNLMELLLTTDALRRGEAHEITAVIPYFGYARQNIQHRTGECVSMNVVVKTLESVGVNKIITCDLHEEGSSGMFSISFENLSTLPILAKQIRAKLLEENNLSESDFVICSPDQGGIERARLFGNSFYQELKEYEVIMIEKKRNLENIHESKAVEIYGDVKNKRVILVDDISTSGGTIIHSTDLCLQKGALAVYAAVVHPDFGQGVAAKIQESSLKEFWTTNTIERTVDDLTMYPKIKITDIASVFKF